MKEDLITFKTAKLAYEKGFNILNKGSMTNMYCITGDLSWEKLGYHNELPKIFDRGFILAPTQSFLQKWLRETYDIDVLPQKCGSGYSYQIYFKFGTQEHSGISQEGWNPTYKESLELGLEQGLMLI